MSHQSIPLTIDILYIIDYYANLIFLADASTILCVSWWRKQSLTGYPDLQSRLPLEEQGLQNQVGDSLVLGRCMAACSALNEFIHDIVLIFAHNTSMHPHRS